jgi:hypothetical protein
VQDSFAVARYLKGAPLDELAELLGVVAAECARRRLMPPGLAGHIKRTMADTRAKSKAVAS